MKKDVHPTYHSATITCACGTSYKSGSTLENVQVELCAACHPFYTGTQKILDSAHRVEKFAARKSQKQDDVKNLATKKKERAAKRKPNSKLKQQSPDTSKKLLNKTTSKKGAILVLRSASF
ncbi:MAG: 50S ribosomal protein L31 [bacterium]|nr:50S ribosomal protein L31 [bacterium]